MLQLFLLMGVPHLSGEGVRGQHGSVSSSWSVATWSLWVQSLGLWKEAVQLGCDGSPMGGSVVVMLSLPGACMYTAWFWWRWRCCLGSTVVHSSSLVGCNFNIFSQGIKACAPCVRLKLLSPAWSIWTHSYPLLPVTNSISSFSRRRIEQNRIE